jgi:hypothetical protein
MDVPYNCEIKYPDSFSIRDVNDEYSQLKSARDAASDSRIQSVIDSRIVELLGEDPDEILEPVDFETHIMYDAQGKAYLAKTPEDHMNMAAQGYTHEPPVGNN